MRAEFERTTTVDMLFKIMLSIDIICVSVFLLFLMNLYIDTRFIFADVFLGILTLLFTVVCVVIADGHKGFIIADDEKITIYFTLFGKELVCKNIEYDKIYSAECEVKAFGRRHGGVNYKMFFTVKTKDGSEMSCFKELSIERDFPVKQPEEYKRYIDQQPLMQLSHYIGKRLHLNTSA